MPCRQSWLAVSSSQVPSHISMSAQMFEGKGHAAVYQKYRFAPGKELQEAILTYLQEKVSRVRPGCGNKEGSAICGQQQHLCCWEHYFVWCPGVEVGRT